MATELLNAGDIEKARKIADLLARANKPGEHDAVVKKLTADAVAMADKLKDKAGKSKPGKSKTFVKMLLSDGGNLYLQIMPTGAISWLFRFRMLGSNPKTGHKRWNRDMGLGSLHDVTQVQARHDAAQARRLLIEGKDPIAERARARAKVAKANTSSITFWQQFEKMQKPRERHGWEKMLTLHAKPIRNKLISDDDDSWTEAIINIVAKLLDPAKSESGRPRWETARKFQQRVQAVLRAARGGALDTPALKSRICATIHEFKKVRANKPFPSIAFKDIPAFMRELQAIDEICSYALQFVILNPSRRGDIVGVKNKVLKQPIRWADVKDYRVKKIWTIPSTKTADAYDPEPFDIPLSDAAIDILKRVEAMKLNGEFIFPRDTRGKRKLDQSMSPDAMQRLMRKLRPGLTTAGMRTTFKTFANEKTSAQTNVINSCLAHEVVSENNVEKHYDSKTTFFEKRRALMNQWARYGAGDRNVVPMKRKRAA
jgi:hypothetical protein